MPPNFRLSNPYASGRAPAARRKQVLARRVAEAVAELRVVDSSGDHLHRGIL